MCRLTAHLYGEAQQFDDLQWLGLQVAEESESWVTHRDHVGSWDTLLRADHPTQTGAETIGILRQQGTAEGTGLELRPIANQIEEGEFVGAQGQIRVPGLIEESHNLDKQVEEGTILIVFFSKTVVEFGGIVGTAQARQTGSQGRVVIEGLTLGDQVEVTPNSQLERGVGEEFEMTGQLTRRFAHTLGNHAALALGCGDQEQPIRLAQIAPPENEPFGSVEALTHQYPQPSIAKTWPSRPISAGP